MNRDIGTLVSYILVAIVAIFGPFSATVQAECNCGDTDSNGAIAINELIQCVNQNLNGCTGCADDLTTGVWDVLVPDHSPPLKFELRIDQDDQCSLTGELLSLNGPLSGVTSVIEGTVSPGRHMVSFNKDAVQSVSLRGEVDVSRTLISGDASIDESEFTWTASRRPEDAPPCDNVSGSWQMEVRDRMSRTFQFDLEIVQEGCAFEGQMRFSNDGSVTAVTNGVVTNNALVFERATSFSQNYFGEIADDLITVSGGGRGANGELSWGAEKVEP